jgi:hypothetical protein
MLADRRNTRLGFTPELYPEGTHICYLYSDDEERRYFLRAFIKSGMAERELVDYLADVPTPEQLEQVAADLAIELPDSGHHVTFTMAHGAYCPEGKFVPGTMLKRIERMDSRRQACGCVGARLTGEMSWALRGIPGSDRLVEYEEGINTLVKDVPVTVLCQYDTRRFDGATIFEILDVHPIMIIRGQIMRNPFYVPPEQFTPRGRRPT